MLKKIEVFHSSSTAVSMNPKSDKTNSLKPKKSFILSKLSLFNRTKNSFRQTKAYVQEKLFKNERYNYLAPLKHMFKLNINKHKFNRVNISDKMIKTSKKNHYYVNEDANKIKPNLKHSNTKKLKSINDKREIASSSSNISATYKAPVEKRKKIRKISTAKNKKSNLLVNKTKIANYENIDLKSIVVTGCVHKSLKRSPLPPPPAPPLTPFLKNQRSFNNKKIFIKKSEKSTEFSFKNQNLSRKLSNSGMIYSNEAYHALNKIDLKGKKFVKTRSDSVEVIRTNGLNKFGKNEPKSFSALNLESNRRCKTSKEILKEISKISNN